MGGILIGSKAVKYWFPDFRQPNDTDYINSNEKENLGHIDFLESYAHNGILLPDALFTLYYSHLPYDVNWKKHFSTYNFLKEKKCKLINEVLKNLESFWQEHHSNTRAKRMIDFNMSNDDFFNDNLTRKIPHDKLHDIVKFGEEPLFKKIKNNLDNANISEELFVCLPHEDKIKLILEEVYVISIERYTNSSASFGYKKSLFKLMTKLSPIFLSYFIIDNFDELIKYKHNENYESFFCR